MDHIDALISRSFSGEAKPADMAELEMWRNASAENEAYYQNVLFIFNAAANIDYGQKVNTEAAWDKIAGKLGRTEGPAVIIPPKRSNTYFLRMAAAILLIIGVPFVIYRMMNPATNNDWELTAEGKEIIQNLPDGSKVWLQPHSKLAAKEGKPNERIYFLKGEAKFEVIHNAEKPFVVEGEALEVRDIGTVFTIKNIDGKDSAVVSVESGSVSFQLGKGVEGTLKANEMAVCSKSMHKILSQGLIKESGLQFDNASLAEVAAKLKMKYGYKLQFGNEALKDCHITVSFQHPTVTEVADILGQTLGLQSSVNGGVILLEGKGCR